MNTMIEQMIKGYDAPSLFAGKLHAVIGRSWKNRVKGRDLYDCIFYLSKGISVNRKHLRERLIQSGHITCDTECSLEEIKHMLYERFETKIKREKMRLDDVKIGQPRCHTLETTTV